MLFFFIYRQVIEGLEVLDKLENVETYNERPTMECKIMECGVFDSTLL